MYHPAIPEDAECVFSGVRADIFQWNQTMYDGSMARFERIRFLDGAFVIPILPNKNILLTIQEQPWRKEFISLPGGSFDFPLENPLQCARRELLEETGYSAQEIDNWFCFEWTANVITFTHYFIAHGLSKVSEITPDAGERIRLFEVSFDEFLELSSDTRFHHHWNLLSLLYEARLFPENKENLRKKLYGV